MKKIMITVMFLTALLQAENFHETKPKAWTVTDINSSLIELYGTSVYVKDERVKIKAPKIASNGGAIPIEITSTIPALSIALFQNSNERKLVGVFKIHKSSLPIFNLKIKMKGSGTVTAVLQGKDGKLYSNEVYIEVALGGCEGDSYYSYSPSQSYSSSPLIPNINNESYHFIHENGFKEVITSPLSTFSADVDTASYSNLRRFLLDWKKLPREGTVRVEEMLNYFNYNYTEPTKKAFAISSCVGDTLWNSNSKIMEIALQTKKIDVKNLAASNLVFLLDVSGSMDAANKLPLVIKSLKLLVSELRKEDTLSIVVYAGSSGLVLDRARGDEKRKIFKALDELDSGGSTAGGEGIKLAYAVAKKAFVQGGNNRIILATDGDFNVGEQSESSLLKLIEEKRKSGIFLTVLGFGTGNYKDTTMELLADKGNGNYAYIDSLLEAKKVLVTEMGSTLYTVAKDVKIQVEFNPKKVHAYRLIGYENRKLNNEDFKNDKVDAGEIGMGHSVTVLYELLMASDNQKSKVDKLKYQTIQTVDSSELATVKIRYKEVNGTKSIEMQKVIKENENDIEPIDHQFAQVVSGFGMLLRESKFNKNLTYKKLIEHGKDAKGVDRDGERAELVKMIEQASLLSQVKEQ